MQQPVIGETVQWFANADGNSEPHAAIVTDRSTNGTITLSILPQHGGTPSGKRNVRYVGDQFLVERPQHKTMYGGWDTIENAKKRATEETKSRLAKKKALAAAN